MPTEERVLCFERKLLEELGLFQGLSLEVEKYLPIVTAASHLNYLNRSAAEQDKHYKQLIPYVLLVCNDKILRYRRGKGGGETRLHGFYSVGIGGHISEEDPPKMDPAKDVFYRVAGVYFKWPWRVQACGTPSARS